MARSKTYKVRFETQRNKVYSSWEFITCETSKKKAIEVARELWMANGNKSHMFHLEAEEFHGEYRFCDFEKFIRANWKAVTWGNITR